MCCGPIAGVPNVSPDMESGESWTEEEQLSTGELRGDMGGGVAQRSAHLTHSTPSLRKESIPPFGLPFQGGQNTAAVGGTVLQDPDPHIHRTTADSGIITWVRQSVAAH